MNKLLALLLVAGLLGLVTGSSQSTAAPAPRPNNKAKIIGKWVLEKTTNKVAPPPGIVVEFTKDGVLKMTMMNPATMKEMTMSGTYKVQGDKLTIRTKLPGGKEMSETMTLTKLTSKQLITKDEKGIVDTFKKK